ncbi:porin, partial [Pseudomonas sp. OA3]|nr:porin [Pseudomonas sp. OA3]
MKNYEINECSGVAKLTAFALGGLLLTANIQAAHAAEEDLAERVRALEEALAAVKAEAQAAQASKRAGNIVTVQERGGRMQLATEDGNFTFR